MTYAATEFEAAVTVKGAMHLHENALFDLDFGVMITQVPSTSCDLFRYKFEVSSSDGLGGDAFTKSTLFDC